MKGSIELLSDGRYRAVSAHRPVAAWRIFRSLRAAMRWLAAQPQPSEVAA